MQDKSFKAWINMHLAKHKMAVTVRSHPHGVRALARRLDAARAPAAAQDLSTDFGDGIKLIKLVETISEETLGKYHKLSLIHI